MLLVRSSFSRTVVTKNVYQVGFKWTIHPGGRHNQLTKISLLFQDRNTVVPQNVEPRSMGEFNSSLYPHVEGITSVKFLD